ncbi:DUF1642 domain-containing protein [Enterococcus durans]|uniref:DUF1642 domain-containing protein n=1 Tax=Enterococcus durans TaxID=53345 RepID=UPI003BEEE320
MNKQELIDEWESKTGAPSYEISDFPINPSKNEMYIAGYGVARTEILKDLKQLDEPQKPKTEVFNHDEKFVVEWLDHTTGYHYSLYNAINDAGSEVRSWMKIGFNSNRFARAFMSMDYEVEKEPKYYLILPHITKMTHGHATKIHNISTGVTKDLAYDIFSEEEIKEIDERYWPFAVPVEEVAEG